jgi:hypothetical protein
MDTMTLVELVNIKKSLDNIFAEKMSPNLAFKFLKLLKQIQNEYDMISAAQQKYSTDYPDDYISKFERFLIESKINISNFEKISQQEIIDSNINISPIDLNNIRYFMV